MHYNSILFHKINSIFPLHILKEDALLFEVHVKDRRMATWGIHKVGKTDADWDMDYSKSLGLKK